MFATGERPVACKRATAVRTAMAAVFAMTICAFSGCAVGPDFQTPKAPAAKAYTAEALPSQTDAAPGTAGATQRFAPGKDISEEWWTLFHSVELDQLIRQALAESPTVAAAKARLREADENRRAQYGALFPAVDANISASRQKISGAGFGQPESDISAFNLYNASVNVSYSPDLFGGTRRKLEALQSQIDYQRFQLEGVYLTLTANIVTTAVKDASLRAQIGAMKEIIEAQERQLDIVEEQLRLGGASRSDVLAQRAQLAQTQALLPPLEKQLAQTRHQLAVLAGRLPSEAALPEFDLNDFQLPEELPVSLTSLLVRQRPDIRAAEETLHAASAQVGVSTANLYPQITLTGSFGLQAGTVGDLFNSGAAIWSFGAGLLQPIFHGGELTAKRRAAIAVYDQAAAQYRDTVLQAFQSVADVLRALAGDASTLKAQAEAAAAARDTLDLTDKQFQLGAVSYLSLLNAERQYEQARLALVQAQAARFADTAALYQALGGGWWNRGPQAEAAATKPE